VRKVLRDSRDNVVIPFSMSRNLIIATVALIAFITLVAYFTFRTDPSTSAAPNGTWWLCSKPSCGNTFNLSLSELAAHDKAHWGQPVDCPKCKSPAIRGMKCSKCGKVYPVYSSSAVCPSCGTPMSAAPPG